MSDKKKFLLRLDGKFYESLERWARDDIRSTNSQIEFLLKEALRRSGRLVVRAEVNEAHDKSDKETP